MDGDEEAFRLLYGRHTPSLFPMVVRLLGGNEADAEDVVQDAWLRAVRALPRFRWESGFRTWLIGIALNRSRELLRQRTRRMHLHRVEPVVAIKPPSTEDRLDLERAVDALTEGYRMVLILHDVVGLTHEEIAERLDIAVGTSKSQLFHARRAVRRLLGGEGDRNHESLRA